MSHPLTEILLWLFIINLGIAFGAGLYETRIILPQWFIKIPGAGYTVDSEAMRANDTGRKFWGFVTTMPLTLLTIANLILAWSSGCPVHCWWMGAAVITLLERIGTFSFFIPAAIKLMKSETLSPGKASSMAVLWIRMNYVRLVFNLVAWLLAMKVLEGVNW